jgi:RNA polymerase sigma factor (sigma-70 family)
MLTDAVLVDRVIAGFDDAFDELYRRHANAAWRLGQAVTGNRHDAADAVSEAFARVLQAVRAGKLDNGAAFRAYLLTATRNASLDTIRRRSTTTPAENETLETVDTNATPGEKLAGHEDAVLVAEAFRNLPERWRSVLWLTEVEGVATKDAADQLGLTPNGTAQLAVRARAGLRERYLQAHVRNHAKPACKFTVDHLGAYVAGAISPRDLAKVDQHLAACEDCRARKEELEDLGSTLRRIAIPIPLALGALSAAKVNAVLAASKTAAVSAGGGFARVAQLAKEPTPMMRRVVAASAAGVLALGVLSLGVVQTDDDEPRTYVAPKRASNAETEVLPEAVLTTSTGGASTSFFTGDAAAAAPPARKAFVAPPAAPAPSSAGGGSAGTGATDGVVADSGGDGSSDGGGDGSDSTVGAGINLGPDDTLGLAVTVGAEPDVTITHNDEPVIGEGTTPAPGGTAVVAVNGEPVFSL